MADIEQFIRRREHRVLEELMTLLRIPSISTLSQHDVDCRRAAEWVQQHLQGLGCPRVDLLASDTHPVVRAEGPEVPGRPTVLVYGHYDVQPPDPLDEWESPPFEPTIIDGNLVARGATDDKGQVFSVITAFEAVSGEDGPPLNVRFLIEGQEESGGQAITELLARDPELVDVDAVLVSDMPFYAKGWPAVYTALRGMCYAEIRVETLKVDLHSGLYGGVAPNAHETLVQILAGLKGPTGRIRIPGLYEAVQRPTRAERDAWKALPFSESGFLKREVGAKTTTGLKRYSVFERIWALPTFEIHGITGGFTDEGAKTVIPAVATAKVSLRLVPNQRAKTVARQLKAAVRALAPDYARVTVKIIHTGDPVQTDVTSVPVTVVSDAFEQVVGRRAVAVRGGGSIPIIPVLAKKKAPVVLAGIGLPDDRLHAPNEKLALGQFWTGVRVFGRFFEMFADT